MKFIVICKFKIPQHTKILFNELRKKSIFLKIKYDFKKQRPIGFQLFYMIFCIFLVKLKAIVLTANSVF